MTVRELNIGDVFRVVGDKKRWRKASESLVRPEGRARARGTNVAEFTDKKIVVVEQAATSDVRRSENTLVLRGGEVTLEFQGLWSIIRCTPGKKFTEFVLSGGVFGSSYTKELTEDAALAFTVGAGAKHLNRPPRSEVFAYKGRVYGRATNMEVVGRKVASGYSRRRQVDGKPRLVIAGVLCIPNEFALYDIIMEHFGPDAVR